MNLSDRVRACREAAGMTQAELATRACVSQQLIAKLETGDVRETRKLPNLAKALGMSVDEFLEFVHADREANAMGRNNARKVLADNIARLVRKFGSQSALAKTTGIPQKTISRALNDENAANLDTLDDLARGLGIEPWQLLVPGQMERFPMKKQMPTPETQAAYDKAYEIGSLGGEVHSPWYENPTQEQAAAHLATVMGYMAGLNDYYKRKGIRTSFFND